MGNMCAGAKGARRQRTSGGQEEKWQETDAITGNKGNRRCVFLTEETETLT